MAAKFPDFETSRLRVTHWMEVLAEPSQRAALEIALDAILTSQVLSPLPPSFHRAGGSSVSAWIDARAAESDVYLVSLRAGSREVIGLLILADMASEDGRNLHLGYLMAEGVWGRGYASELVSGLVDAAHAQAPMRILAGVAPDNAASAKVLQKRGFQRDVPLETGDMRIYTLQLS